MISLQFDLSALVSAAKAVQGVSDEDLPFACAYALTKGMQAGKAAEVDTMRRVFDRPVPYTLNALAVIPATKERLVAELHVRTFGGTPAFKYLAPHIHGGQRPVKRFERALIAVGAMRAGEFAVPTRLAPLDGNGNLGRGVITRILSDVGASPVAANTPGVKRRKRWKRGKGVYFVVRGQPRLRDGIYFRLGQRDVRPILLFTRAPNYSVRFPYYEVAQQVIPRACAEAFSDGWRRYVVPKLQRRMRRQAA